MTKTLVQRLRSRLVIVPKPGAKPFRPTYPIMGTSTIGGEHKPGDPAGYSTINPSVGACAAGYDPSNWMMLEMVYAVDPLCEEAAAALDRRAVEPSDGLVPMLEDGFGTAWQRCALGMQCRLQIVRPGKVQCDCWETAEKSTGSHDGS